jgi:hypothetical protein
MFKTFLKLSVLLLIQVNTVYACLPGGENPDNAFYSVNSNSYYADGDSVCSSGINSGYYVFSSTFNPTTLTQNCIYYLSVLQGQPNENTNAYGRNFDQVSGDAAYGACGGVTPEFAGVCNNGEITSDYRDPQCSDNTEFTEDGQNITTTIDTISNTDVTTTVQTDSNGETTTITNTTTTDTNTTQSTTSDGTVISTDIDLVVTEDINTVVTDSGGTIISDTTTTTVVSGSNGGSGGSGDTTTASVSSSCSVSPTCSGDQAQCATLIQIWLSACMNEDTSIEPDHLISDDLATVATTFSSRIENAPISQAFANITNLISNTSSTCPPFSIDLQSVLGVTPTTTIHCDVFSLIQVALSPIMFVVYSFFGFRIIASA